MLANLHAVEVDFPKTGKHVEVPQSLLPPTFPNYMHCSGNSYLLYN